MIDLSQEELLEKLDDDDKAFIVDVRTKEEYEESHIPNSTLMDIKDPKSFIEEIENLDTAFKGIEKDLKKTFF